MILRIAEIYVPRKYTEQIKSIPGMETVIDRWEFIVDEEYAMVRILGQASEIESLLDILQSQFAHFSRFRILVLPVETTIPKKEEPSKEEEVVEDATAKTRIKRIYREELHDDIVGFTHLSWEYVIMVILSSTVASIGLIRSSAPIIIGAMVIAPFLGPNMALALSVTLADFSLAKKALKVTVVGCFVALVFSVLLGMIFTIDPQIPEIAFRTEVGISDIMLALASGTAAALSMATGTALPLVGVMVAVAMLPPLVTFGMLLGEGEWVLANRALLLFLTNIICVNLSGVLTYVFCGIRPRTWFQADQARKGY